MKSGFIAILGRPNAGKSSLMNALVGEKVSIVSPRAQTTRNKILGIYTDQNTQMIFVDTPGVHEPKNRLGEHMKKEVKRASEDVDAIVIVLDALKQFSENDLDFIERYLKQSAPVYVAVNKTDLAGYERVYPILAKLVTLTSNENGKNAVKEIIPISCKTGENIDVLKKYLEGELTEGVEYFSPDDITDKSERFMICEIVREKALLYLQEEIPHGIGVQIQTMTVKKSLAEIEIDIICEKETHKSIIIGAGGEKLKTIASTARRDIEKMLGLKTYMKIFVKVRDNWRDKKTVLSDLGYSDK